MNVDDSMITLLRSLYCLTIEFFFSGVFSVNVTEKNHPMALAKYLNPK